MQLFFQKNHRLLFYSSWLCLALMQATSTELIADEAYYWVYSRFLDFGYFDHPPMIALLIKAGYALFQNEFGVRLICAVMSTLTILITESLIEKKNPFLFYTIVLSIGVLQIIGFLAVPDTPLLFFTAIFFYCFKHYLHSISWRNTLFLAISIVLLFYTKYHGLLIVFFAFLSNLKLFLKGRTCIVTGLVILLYLPHLWWQWEHNWVSFRYHLFESNVSTYKISYTSDYLLGQLLLAGPLAGLLLLPAAFFYSPRSKNERALKFTFVGLYLVFLISSFRGKVEVNWTMPVIVPLIVLSHQYLLEKSSWIKPLKIIALISLVLIIAGRLYLVVDIGPDNSTKKRFHFNKEWAEKIKSKTGNTPVVFYNSYQRTSLYWFYSGIPSHSHNWYGDRRSNYNFWPTEDNLLGEPVFLADIYGIDNFYDSIMTRKGMVGLQYDTLYAGLSKIQIKSRIKKLVIDSSGTISLKCRSSVSRKYYYFITTHLNLSLSIFAGIFKGKELIKEIDTNTAITDIINSGDDFILTLNLKDIPTGKYDLRLGIKSKNYPVTHNSDKIELIAR